jgi:hypothetical protein
MGLIFPKRQYFKSFPLQTIVYVLRREWRLAWRECKLLWQRRVRGWDDSDTYSLDGTIAKFILPRLKRFKEVNNGVPNVFCSQGTDIGGKIWDSRLDKMIRAMELVIKNHDTGIITQEEAEEITWGLNLFGQHFMDLWW